MKLLYLMKNNIKVIAPIAVILAVTLYAINYVNGLKDEISKWQNEAATLRGTTEVAQNLYESQGIEVKNLRIENESLKDRLEETDRDALYYSRISLRYKSELDSIKTVPADTVYISSITDSLNYIPEIGDRIFDYTIDNEITLSGFFQTKEPYNLYVNDFELLMNLDVVISQYQDGSWWYNIDTGSPRLKPEKVNVQINPRPDRWEPFIGGKVLFIKTSPVGVGIVGGLKINSYAVNIGVNSISDYSPTLELGFVRYFNY